MMATAPPSQESAFPERLAADGPPGRFASSINVAAVSAPAALPHASAGPPTTLIRRTLKVTQLQDYHYTGAVKNIITRLCLVPPRLRGYQRLLSHELRAVPLPHAVPEFDDAFGNHFLEIHQERVSEHLTIVITLQLENACAYDEAGKLVPTAIPDRTVVLPESIGGKAAFLSLSRLTEPDEALRAALEEVKRDLPDPGDDPFGFAKGLCGYVYRQMRYASGSTGVSTSAREAWEARRGVCQDFTHIFLTLSRLAGVPARYVSGFLPGEGAMHAWVEILLPTPSEGGTAHRSFWYALDPTHDTWVSERYTSVATGRDYYDIMPNSGSYFGRARNTLRHRSKVVIESTIKEPLTPQR
ncbi:MAG: transglutaminase family protein [Cytophagales bacterium]|nr:transglutaminase family protein [Armatimonadota bacterium]